ncbi:MAG: helix-turn-helix domain-containing protein [Woeseiaceae bacterium]|jgi:hypothetical protein
MADNDRDDALLAAVRPLRSHGVVPGAVAPLRASRPQAIDSLRGAIETEVRAWSLSANPDLIPELHTHLERHFDETERLFGGSRPGEWAFVRGFAGRLAATRFPLEALLHTYRCLHKALSEWVRDAALAAADESAHVRRVVAATAEFASGYADIASTLATSEYVEATRRAAEAEGDQRTELLNLLLRGYDEADARAAQLLRKSGYLEQRQSYCVVAARSVNPAEMESPARAQRMANAIGEVLANTPLRTLIGVRDNLVLAIVSGTRRMSGWTAPRSLLADRLMPELRKVGPAALIGMSNDVPSTSHIPRAAIEARLALDFAGFTERVMPYSSITLPRLLVAHSRDKIGSALPAWLDDFTCADKRARGRLGETLRAYADADMNVLGAAKALGIHPNTVYSRAQKINDVTGKSMLSYHDLTELLMAIACRSET